MSKHWERTIYKDIQLSKAYGMNTLDDLLNESHVEGTTIQKQERLKKYINAEIIIEGTIIDIKLNGIYIKSKLKNSSIFFESETMTNIIEFGQPFADTLFKYSYGDIVKISAKLTGANVEGYNCNYWFILSSIDMLSTAEQEKENNKKIHEKITLDVEKEQRKINNQVFVPIFLISFAIACFALYRTIHSNGNLIDGFFHAYVSYCFRCFRGLRGVSNNPIIFFIIILDRKVTLARSSVSLECKQSQSRSREFVTRELHAASFQLAAFIS